MTKTSHFEILGKKSFLKILKIGNKKN